MFYVYIFYIHSNKCFPSYPGICIIEQLTIYRLYTQYSVKWPGIGRWPHKRRLSLLTLLRIIRRQIEIYKSHEVPAEKEQHIHQLPGVEEKGYTIVTAHSSNNMKWVDSRLQYLYFQSSNSTKLRLACHASRTKVICTAVCEPAILLILYSEIINSSYNESKKTFELITPADL